GFRGDKTTGSREVRGRPGRGCFPRTESGGWRPARRSGGRAVLHPPSARRLAGYDRTFGQVCSIQVYVDVGSPLGHPGGAVIFRMGIVTIRLGSRTRDGRFFSSYAQPVTVPLVAR